MRVSAKRWLACGKASNYIKQANIKPGDKVVLVCRVSDHEQGRRNNHADQDAAMRQQVEQLGGTVVDSLQLVASGFDPYWIERARLTAKEHGASLLAESAERYRRHPAYHSKENPSRQARDSDWRELAWWADGVPLLTMLPPDATPDEVKSYQSKRGQRMKRAKGGRPERPKNRRKRLRPLALEMRAAGASLGEIAKAFNVPRSTVADWCRDS